MTGSQRVWWREPFRMFQTNLREIDAATMDVDDTLDYLERFGADTWLLSVGGIVSNYPTSLSSQTANPALAARPSGDLVGDAVAAASRRGIRVMARMDFSKVDHRRAELHPDWCFVDPEGRRQVYNGLTSVCPSAGYYQNETFAVVAEVLDRYGVSGFFFNWLTYNERDYSRRYRGVCQCAACVRRFAQWAPGLLLPVGPESDSYDEWRRFADDSLEALTLKMRNHIAELAPEAMLVQGTSADVLFHEANNAVGRPLWHVRTAEQVSAARTARPDTPVLVNSVAFVDMPYRLAGEDPQHFAQYLVQAISRGAYPSTYIMGGPCDGPHACLETAGELTRFHRDHTDVYRDLVPAARTLLVRPDALRRSAVAHTLAVEEFRGLSVALLERHVPFDVVDERQLAALPDDDGHRMIIVPDLGPLEPAAQGRLDRAVEAGAAVVFTGATAPFAGSPVERVLARLDTFEELLSLHVGGLDGPSEGWAEPFAVVGAIDLVVARGDAETALPVIGRAPFGPPEKCHGHLETGHPGFLRRRSGSGTVAVIPWTIGRALRATGSGRLGDAIVRLLSCIDPDVVIPTNLPGAVEIALGRSAFGTVAHLLNRSGDRTDHFTTPVPIGPATVTLPWPEATKVRALRAGTDLSCTAVEGGVAVDLPGVDLFEVLVAESPVT